MSDPVPVIFGSFPQVRRPKVSDSVGCFRDRRTTRFWRCFAWSREAGAKSWGDM
ncbi:hypothetical protein I5G67_gp070 [Mycobacterium phage Aminay]|uniref:Uncharacterized protein n=1 Tax=Mycobacterium phage Aminay TaxID=2250291 RepID=A0A345KV91_9CAUD|nr:hypothetical protein I5G67_gp070 [Mycobacterium phage Aminay]AXH46943.1 hypothetical protein SEA_AMINAY_70 [Mycobacterium phage Aminay]